MGVTAVEAGIPLDLAIAMSSVLYAGAAQFAAISLLETNSPILVIVFTIIVINLRFMIYSASLAPHFQSYGIRKRLVCAYFVSDHSYAASIPRLTADASDDQSRLWFYLGAAVPAWDVWQVSTILGVTVGTHVPTTLSLEFTIPLAFIGLLFSMLETRIAGVVALAAGSIETVATALPHNLGLIVGTFVGISVGISVTWFRDSHPRAISRGG